VFIIWSLIASNWLLYIPLIGEKSRIFHPFKEWGGPGFMLENEAMISLLIDVHFHRYLMMS
jgi:hypothetical protein